MIQMVSDMVRRCRKQRGLTRLELAELAGVGKTVVFDIEQGKETVQLDTATKILGALGIQASFRASAGPPPPKPKTAPPRNEPPPPDDDQIPVYLL